MAKDGSWAEMKVAAADLARDVLAAEMEYGSFRLEFEKLYGKAQFRRAAIQAGGDLRSADAGVKLLKMGLDLAVNADLVRGLKVSRIGGKDALMAFLR